jgi:DNA-binding IclR family transcriptional regulator
MRDGTYDLGTLALNAGLAKLARLNRYRTAQECLEALGRSSGETAMMAMWNGHAAVAIRWIESPRPITVFVRPGSQLPLLNSATGRVFAAFLPDAVSKAAIDRERQAGVRPSFGGKPIGETEFAQLLDDVRKRALARVQGDLTVGISAFAAPVFDHDDRIAFVFALAGPSGSFSTEWDSPAAALLLEATASCTSAIGGRWRWSRQGSDNRSA